MKIVLVASEMVPFARAGGLGDVVGALALELGKMGHDVKVILPKYGVIRRQKFRLKKHPDLLEVPLGRKLELCMVQSAKLPYGAEALLIDKPEYFDRDELYGTPQGAYPDNDRRFIVFQRAALELMRRFNIRPDVLHCHDWQTGLIPLLVKTRYAQDQAFKKTRTVFTVHNLSEQGLFPPDSLAGTGVDWKDIALPKVQHFDKISFLKVGLAYADMLTTVSQRYSEEIQTSEFGCGMEDLIRSRAQDLEGIINGIDTTIWNPETDTAIFRTYSRDMLDARRENTAALERELGLIAEGNPLFAFVGRFNRQKGMDIMIPALKLLAQIRCRAVILGQGEDAFQDALHEIALEFPKRVSVQVGYDEHLARRIYAGADIMIIPSAFEPCGLGQMISLRYGAVPLVRATGGLRDMVKPCDEEGKEGNGFMFEEMSAEALLTEAKRAMVLFQNRRIWRELMHQGMSLDVSWKVSAKRYVEVYKKTLRKPVGVGGES